MVLLGELCGFGVNTAHAQCRPGDAEEILRAAARDSGVWLVPGSLYERDGDAVYNTTPVIDPDGKVVARYRKMFPFAPYERGVAPGSEFVVFAVPGAGRFGVSICYDMWFPEPTRSLAILGAEVLLHPTLPNTIDRHAALASHRPSTTTHPYTPSK